MLLWRACCLNSKNHPELWRSFCWATGRHMDLHTLNTAICPIPVNRREVKVRAQSAKRQSLLLSHLSSLQIHPPFSVTVRFKTIVWEWEFSGCNNVIRWFAAQVSVRRGPPPILAVWNCCAGIHRGAVYCGTTHSTHCFCTLNDRLSHNVKSKWILCANVICMQTASSWGQRWGMGLEED